MENQWLFLVLVVGAILCAYRMMVSTRILVATLYLACISALVSIMLYLLGGTQVAAIELSVGAGLVTVLLVYAISVVGDDALDPASIVPKPLAMISVLAAAVFLAWLAIPIGVTSKSFTGSFNASCIMGTASIGFMDSNGFNHFRCYGYVGDIG